MEILGILLGIVLVFIIWALYMSIGACILYFAWNWVMPPLFGLPDATVLQAFGIMILLGFIKGILNVNVNNNNKK